MAVHSIETADLSTVDAVLDRAAEINGDVEAFVEPAVGAHPRRAITFAQWRLAADAAAAWLVARGVGPGDVVSILLGPSIDFAVLYQACLRIGAIATGINTRMGETERNSIFERMLPVCSVVEDDLFDDLPASAGALIARSELASLPAAARPEGHRALGTDPVAVVWTSGTTGLPKGALFDHASLAAVAAGTDVLSQAGDRRLSPLPFSHVSYVTRAWDEIAHGVTTIISPSPWRARSALDVMIAEDVTVAQGVPTQWALLLELEELDASHLPNLRVAGTGAARMAPSQVAALRSRLNVPVVVRYTSTETSLGTGTRPGDPDEIVATTVGRPVAGVEIALIDDAGAQVSVGEVGRVRLRSAASMRGYVAPRRKGEPIALDRTATRAVIDDQGWVTTGDFGRLDDAGNLTLVGRDNELYQRGGYNVYPAEVERVLDGLAGVAQVAVVAGEDAILGEVGVAFVVRSAAMPVPSLAQIRSHVAAVLADYKAPDAVVELAALPLTAMGKVDKRALKPEADRAAGVRSAQVARRRSADGRVADDLGHDDASKDQEGERP